MEPVFVALVVMFFAGAWIYAGGKVKPEFKRSLLVILGGVLGAIVIVILVIGPHIPTLLGR